MPAIQPSISFERNIARGYVLSRGPKLLHVFPLMTVSISIELFITVTVIQSHNIRKDPLLGHSRGRLEPVLGIPYVD